MTRPATSVNGDESSDETGDESGSKGSSSEVKARALKASGVESGGRSGRACVESKHMSRLEGEGEGGEPSQHWGEATAKGQRRH